MNWKFFYFCFLTSCIILLSTGCTSYKTVPYFQNSDEFDGSKGPGLYDLKIKNKDRLTIIVTSIDPEAVKPFIVYRPRAIDFSKAREGRGVPLKQSTETGYYLVENDGTINFPLIGKVSLVGKTIPQVNQTIKDLIAPYFQKGVDYQVNTYIQNYQISVMGEVNNPNTFNIGRNKCTVLEALAMAGDMTIYGKRDNVKILRELTDGTYEVHELDMRDANILNSPYYYLQQRDIVYVEPNEVMVQESKIGRTTQLWVRGASITISLGSLLYMVLK